MTTRLATWFVSFSLLALARPASSNIVFSLSDVTFTDFGLRTVAFAVGDLNQDGYLDLVAGQRYTDGPDVETPNVVYLGGPAGLRPGLQLEPYDPGTFTSAVLAIDVDGDLDLDVVDIANTGDEDCTDNPLSVVLVLVHANRGDGTFDPPYLLERLDFAERSTDVADGATAADFDRDGSMDILINANTCQTGPIVEYLMLVHTNGAPADTISIRAGEIGQGPTRYMPSSGDVNQDGYPDALIGDELYLWSSLGPTVVPAPTEGTLVDVDGDGLLDLLGSRTYRNLGPPFFSQPAIDSLGLRPSAVADFDGDGDVDVVSRLQIYENDGSGRMVPGAELRAPLGGPMAAADLNGDGLPDLIYGSGESVVRDQILPNRTPPFATTAVDIGIFPQEHDGLSAFDWDHDGDLDIHAGRGMFRNDGGTFALVPGLGGSQRLRCDPVPGPEAHDDLLCCVASELGPVGFQVQPYLFRYRATPDGLTTEPDTITMDSPVFDIHVADIDKDGFPEAIVAMEGENAVLDLTGPTPQEIWRGSDSRRTFTATAGDIDEDGFVDILFGNDGPNTLYLVEESGIAPSPAWQSDASFETWVLALGDLDGAGGLDLFCGNVDGGDRVYVNESSMLSMAPVFVGAATPTTSATLVDVDGDGRLDAVRAGLDYRTFKGAMRATSVAFNTGLGSLFPEQEVEFANGDSNLLVLDADMDGDLDLVRGPGINDEAGLHPGSFVGPRLTLANSSPRCVLGAPTRSPGTNAVEIPFVIYDPDADRVHYRLEFQREGDASGWRDIPGGSGAVPATAEGVSLLENWDVEDLEIRDPRRLRVRLRVSDLAGRVAEPAGAALAYTTIPPVVPLRPELRIPMNVIDYRFVTLGDTVEANIVIENTGTAALMLEAMPPDGVDLSPSPSLSVEPFGMQEVGVKIAPSLPGALAPIRFTSNDPRQPTTEVRLEGTVLPLRVSTNVLADEGPLPLGAAVTLEVLPADNVVIEGGMIVFGPSLEETLDLRTGGGDDSFFVVVPGEAVTEAGLRYFIRVWNSSFEATDPPNVDGGESPFFRSVSEPQSISSRPVTGSTGALTEEQEFVVEVTIPMGTLPQASGNDVFYRAGGESSFASVPLVEVPSLGLLSATIPGSVVGFRGVEYYARVQTQLTTLTHPAMDPENNPLSAAVRVGRLGEDDLGRAPHPGRAWHMLSFPLDFRETVDQGVVGLLSDELGAYPVGRTDSRVEWLLYRYLPESGNVEFTPAEAGSIFQPVPGRAFWVNAQEDHLVDSGPVPGFSTPTDGPWPIALSTGWNQVASPFAFAVTRSGLFLSSGGPLDIRRYVAGDYSPDVPALEPFDGYFVLAEQPDTLWVSPIAHGPAARIAEIPDAKEGAWWLWLRADSDQARDGRIGLGVAPDARDEQDHLDLRKAPSAPGPWVRLAMKRESWAHPGPYERDVRSSQGDGHQWSLDVTSATRGETVTLSAEGLVDLPEDVMVKLVDPQQAVSVDLRRERSYSLLSHGASQSYPLVVVAGSASFVERESRGLVRVPSRLTLDRSTPNPFNPATRIRFGLPEAMEVRLEVFDVRGARVATLVANQLREAGYHTVVWRGEDHRGRRVGSGVYLYRLRAGAEVLTERMTLLR